MRDDFVELSYDELMFLMASNVGRFVEATSIVGLDGRIDRLPSGEPGPGRLLALGLVRPLAGGEYASLVNPGRLFRCEGKLWRAVASPTCERVGYVSMQTRPKSPSAAPAPEAGHWSDEVLKNHDGDLSTFKQAAAMVEESDATGRSETAMTPERVIAYLRLVGLGAIVSGKMTEDELRAFFENDAAVEGGSGLAEAVKFARDYLARKIEEEG